MGVVEIGRLCIKLAGRDAGRECLIIEDLGKGFVMIDGNTRRRKCNLKHLELLPQKAKIKKGATHEEVLKALSELGVKVKDEFKKKEKKPKTEKKEEKREGLLKRVLKKEQKPEKPAPKKKESKESKVKKSKSQKKK